jgi:Uma2 family endonuclease
VATGLVEDALRAAFGPRWVAGGAKPIALDDESEPEPDVAIVPGPHRQCVSEHPARPVLVVEVAESSLVRDRTCNASLYARAAIADYWIVNLVDRVLEVHRDPRPDPAARFGWGYASITRLGPGDTVSPLSAPAARILVADLLP